MPQACWAQSTWEAGGERVEGSTRPAWLFSET